MPSNASNYKSGAFYSLITAALLATQHPFSLLGAKQLSVAKFILVGEVVLVMFVPLLLFSANSRRDFRKMISSGPHLLRFLVLLLIGLLGVFLYNIGLSKSHPIVVAAVLNLAPFWAAIIALVISRKAIPTSWWTFFACLIVAFGGAMMIAISQTDSGPSAVQGFSLSSLAGPWIYAVPVPALYALSGTLIGKWFADYDDSAALAVTFVTAAAILIPATFIYSYSQSDLAIRAEMIPAIVMLAVGTAGASGLGRVLYQVSLTKTSNDNGFVSMFFLLIPGVTALFSLALSPWISDLKFSVGPLFYAGLVVVAVPIFLFSWRSWKSTDSMKPT
jgi:drug/metabolite transporter (DMT)-like permease